MTIFTILYLLIPFIYIFLISATEENDDGIVPMNLNGGFLILVVYMLTLVFVESNDKPTYLESYLDAENYYGSYDRELLWGKLQLFLSSFLMKNELLYWLFYTFFYCVAYYLVARKYFPFQYAGYFVLCVIGCMGFVSYGSNTIRAGFGIALLLMAFCTEKRLFKVLLLIAAVGCNMPMVIPVAGFLIARYLIRKERWCEIIWLVFLLISAVTSVVSDIMTLASGLDARAAEFVENDGSDMYNAGFRIDFVLYSFIPVVFAKYNLKHLMVDLPIYNNVYRAYLLINALWLLLIRVAFSDRFAYLSWFMIPFLLMYPVLNGYLENQHPQRYIFRAIGLFLLVNVALTLKSAMS